MEKKRGGQVSLRTKDNGRHENTDHVSAGVSGGFSGLGVDVLVSV